MSNSLDAIRNKKIKVNLATSMLNQAVVIIGGFIVPRLILNAYGSQTNGLINSITQFLGIISFLDMGVGMVVTSTLFRPLAQNDSIKISEIISSSDKFYRKIGCILLLYVGILSIFYPAFIAPYLPKSYVILLIFIISIELFSQYFLGITDLYLLTAMQESYVQYTVQTITYLFSLMVSIILIVNHSSIIIVKACSSFFLALRPVIIRLYIQRKISINRFQKYREEPISQKWYGIGQHISFVVLQNTDAVILSLFKNLSEVSIYAVYNMVIIGIKAFISSATSSVMPAFGDLFARDEMIKARNIFNYFEWLIHNVIVLIFGCTSVLLLPFVMVYTNGINDVDYSQPVFAFVITLANAMHCIRLPYNIIIKAAGKYKETQGSYYISAVSNVVLSIILVNRYGLVGVAVGTLISMAFHTFWMVIYQSANIIERSLSIFGKQLSVDFLIFIIAYKISMYLYYVPNNYFEWIKNALITFGIWSICVVIINMLFYRHNIGILLKRGAMR
ncbi:sugar isomerase [Butyrivibrio fibrisolvens]|uniref:Sugar isomerase n=2 Tax=Butyrivibrio fibrisolvens TaxID=831 RepID=A0A317G3G5_BUTFI|nr:sugar isomerase [Butyrivibrio fibrisolvens]